MNKILFFILFCAATLFATQPETNKTLVLEQVKTKLDRVNSSIENDIWIKKYNDYLTYKQLLLDQEDAKDKIYVLKKQGANASELKNAQKRLDTIKNQLSLIEQYKRSSLGDLTLIEDVADKPEVTNPISIIYALTAIQKSVDQVATYKQRLISLEKAIELIETKKKLLQEERKNDDENRSQISEQLEQINSMLKDFENERDDFETTISIYERKTQDLIKTLQNEIKDEVIKLAIILFVILIIIVTAMISKRVAKKYWSDHHQERLYIASKIINFSAVVLIIVALLVAYSSNLGYMVTILGFASAGIAISLKDWFLSILGWMVILTTGQIKAGNRIKVIGKDGEVAGDILDVSLMKITIYEDVSLLSYSKDKRAGRIIFIPNSYIFTHIFLNYNHSGMQTIWDSVYVALSFDSDLEKAIEIAKDIAQKHSKAVTRLADMQMNRLRANYNIPKYGTTPRAFTFLDNGCVVLHVWFLCNYFTPMATKSAVTRELIKAFQEAENITMIYTPHTVMLHKQNMPPQPE